jgi:HEAT repeat protein
MTTTCPACNKTVDPLRSRFVGVQGGKVVAYCSAECAGRTQVAEPRQATAGLAGATPAAGAQPAAAAPPAAGVPVRVATSAAGATSASGATPAAGAPSAAGALPAAGVPVRVATPSAVATSAAGAAPAAVAAPAAGVPDRAATPGAGVPVRAATPAAVATAAAGATPAAAATPAAGVPVRAATPGTDVSAGPPRPLTPAPGVPLDPARADAVVDSGPVIEILHEPASGVVTSARDERTEPRAKHPDEIPIAEFWSADREKSGAVRAAADPVVPPGDGDPAAPARGAAVVERPRAVGSPSVQAAAAPDDLDADLAPARRSRAPLVILLLVLLGAGGYLAYQYLLKGNLAAATRIMPAPAARPARLDSAGSSREAAGARLAVGAAQVSAEHRPPPAIDVSATVAQARATLAADLTATSPRVQRIAAAALARTQDPAARAVLAAQLGLAVGDDAPPGAGSPPRRERETSDIARLDLAYSLARGGDPRGAQALAAALGSQRGEIRDEAARLLALLGDPRAVPHLTDLLAVSQRRLGAAEHLAHLAEPHAIKVLEQIRADPRTSAADRARATIALGIARHADVAPALRALLGDPHENAFVAAALAELKDSAARPVLEQQLESPALRVRAARALRRLDPALDPRPLLARMVDVLKTGRDIDQIQAAEAILLLAGPASWSAYD